MPATEPASERRTRIADAIIATLAERGSRGLSHRAVDAAAGLPTGSTSYYLRSRRDLLEAAVDRLATLDADAVPDLSGHDPAAALAVALHRLLEDDRPRLLARYELVLEATRRPELRDALAAGRARIRDVLARSLARDDPEGADERADAVLALADGLLLQAVAGTSDRRATVDSLHRALAMIIGPRG